MNNLRTQSACQFLVVTAAILLNACQNITTQQEHATPRGKHPLTDKIWDVNNQKMITADTLLQRLAKTRYVFLGETHDNEDHHRIQAKVLQNLIAVGERPVLAMEQFDTEYQSAIDESVAAKTATVDSIATAGHFDRKGWNWPFYAPLITRALEAKLPIVALNLSRSKARNVAGRGFEAVENENTKKLLLTTTWSQPQNETLLRQIVEGHCGNVPEEMLPKIIIAQRARDATMANALIDKTTNSAVVILGREHARKDIGAPIYLTSDAASHASLQTRFIAVALTEVESNRDAPSDYLSQTQEKQAFDYVWFTPPAQREDPCAGAVLPSSR